MVGGLGVLEEQNGHTVGMILMDLLESLFQVLLLLLCGLCGLIFHDSCDIK